MTDHERAAINMASCPSIDKIPDFTGASPTTPELRARVEALEAAQLEQAESNRFCIDAIVRRVEALEAQQSLAPRLDMAVKTTPLPPHINQFTSPAMTELRAASAEARPAGLVERVATCIERTVDFDPDSYAPEARAAICEVAKWLREQGTPASGWAMRLEQEADRG
jgi:hypothetical protein